jgi:hypothetical protein
MFITEENNGRRALENPRLVFMMTSGREREREKDVKREICRGKHLVAIMCGKFEFIVTHIWYAH